MPDDKIKLDETDLKILEILKGDSRASLEEISRKVNISKSTVHYRIKRMIDKGIIEKFSTKLNYKALGYDIFALSCVKAKYHQHSMEDIAKKIKQVEGVESVFVILGEMDFLITIRARNKDELKGIVEKIISFPEIDHSSTYLVISEV
ncbi:MAG: Lrp/AsnC family transcriptional regulator [Thermoplasmata archaeon]|jgi:DNA-binding Lrp family transcriptional regulator|nr:MAG: Lrp/AsnC family transcriptional regulator [Aciduliprofundum sp.]